MVTKIKKKVWPKKMGACADLLYQMRASRLEEASRVKEMEKDEKDLKTYIIDTLPKSEASGVAGAMALVKVIRNPVPQVKDWDKFAAHILKTKDLGFLTKAINKTYIDELLEAGVKIPGIEIFDAVTVSCTKL